MRMRRSDSSVLPNLSETEQKLPQLLHANDAVFVAETEEWLERIVGHFDDLFGRRIQKLNASKIKILASERDGLLHVLLFEWHRTRSCG